MKKELIWCRKCGKYAVKPCKLTRDDMCPECGSLELYDVSADPDKENYFCFDDYSIVSIEELAAGYEENKNNDYFCDSDIECFTDFLEMATDMGGDLVAARFTGEF